MEQSSHNLIDPLLEHARTRPDEVFLRGPLSEPRLELTWAQLTGLIAPRTRELAALYAQGERVILIAPTTAEFVIEYYAAQAAGLTVVAVNPLSTPRELAYYIADSGASAIHAHPATAEAGETAAREAGIPFAALTTVGAESVAAAAREDLGALSPARLPAEHVATMLYTSGTTGRPKGAMLTVRNLLDSGRNGVEASGLTTDDRSGTALPLFHVFGLASVLICAVAAGGQLTLLPRFDAVELMRVMDTDRLTLVAGVPTMWNAITHAPEGEYDFSSLRFALSGGASIAVGLMRRFEERFGARIAEGYGLTETTAQATLNRWDGVIKPGTVGTDLPNIETKIVALDGTDADVDEVGEVCVRGSIVMAGYWNRPEATAEAIDADGWFRTGDLGSKDADGYLSIVDRLKEMIIHGGYNVYPREIEEVLYEHPGVLEAAVIGSPDEHYGQIVAAAITPMPGVELTAAEIEAFCRERLSAYKIPRIIRFLEALPKGATGKIQKREIALD
ncbi:AMP-binding protein [Brevibacterium sp. BRM-1]|uniref:AMP-binding protein n=1 Tax=Brevibacterium sp. BRM-1 TaxID=2999062 RepID=UPI0022809728|nr:AMP-binding protein [Brevibacterium sp. BRM-1]WAL41142.1 AMP-binding protein [Brevibacterium sp. BRM-1]